MNAILQIGAELEDQPTPAQTRTSIRGFAYPVRRGQASLTGGENEIDDSGRRGRPVHGRQDRIFENEPRWDQGRMRPQVSGAGDAQAGLATDLTPLHREIDGDGARVQDATEPQCSLATEEGRRTTLQWLARVRARCFDIEPGRPDAGQVG